MGTHWGQERAASQISDEVQQEQESWQETGEDNERGEVCMA